MSVDLHSIPYVNLASVCLFPCVGVLCLFVRRFKFIVYSEWVTTSRVIKNLGSSTVLTTSVNFVIDNDL